MTEPNITQCGNCEGIDPSTCFVCRVAQPAGQPLDLDAIQARADDHADHQKRMGWSCCTSHHSANDVPALLDEIRRLRELLDERTGDIADKALENASLRSQLTAIRSWAETTSNGSAAAAVATLMDDPPRINYCGYCGFSHASCRC